MSEKEPRCWICKRTAKEVIEELKQVKNVGFFQAGVPPEEFIEKPFDNHKDNTLHKIPLCQVCNYIMGEIAWGTIDDRTGTDLLTEKDLQRLKVTLEIDPDANVEEEDEEQ
jgi:hypothetical protein